MDTPAAAKTSGINWKDKIGYAMGDGGGTLFLGVIGSYLTMFYSDVLHIPMASITVLLLALRVWDGINDPIWGTIVDRRPAGKNGKFRPYLRAFCVPLALCGVLMFTKIPGLSAAQYLIYAYITHILYEGFYTTVNMPLGAMASVITDDGAERSQLSTYRTIGSGMGSAVGAVVLPQVIFSRAQDGADYLDGNKLFLTMLVLAVCSVALTMLSFRMTTERVPPPPAEEKHNIFGTVRVLLRNRPYLALCFAAMLLIGVTMYTQTVYGFLYKDYFSSASLNTYVSIATYAPTAILVPFIQKLVRRFGKKRLCAWGLLLSAAANTLALLLRTSNPYVFMGFCFFSGLGGTFLNMQLWALIADVLDYQELLSRKREEGTCYALFFFMRKIGQTLAGSGSAFLLGKIGYDENKIVQSPGVANRMYTTATLAPAAAYALMFLAMAFWYPLDPKKEEKIREDLRMQRAAAQQEALA
ncbi:MAG: glycoside-pentoside-hexuronide (GPH):cation symporter [Firmicutes bacterium]|nr:glycoside-pentoside-hexuronide (GPH):cation symporter [Bacillota bacterium]